MQPCVEISRFDVTRAAEWELHGYHRLRVDTAADWSDEPPPDRVAAVAGLLGRMAGVGEPMYWAAYANGRLIGFTRLWLPAQENAQVGVVEITVHPEVRRQGVGSGLLRPVLRVLETEGRTMVEGWAVTRGGPGARWASGMGFRPVQITLLQRLVIDEVEPSSWAVTPPSGYHAVRWIDPAPDAHLASYVRARAAIHDAPVGDEQYRSPDWTVERIREAERDRQASGLEHRVVAAVNELDGTIVGFTEIELGHRPDLAHQGDTAVMAGHRGHGLGRYIKAVMARWLLHDRPRVSRVLTATAASNTHMIRVNHQIGYTDSRTMLVLSAETAAVAARLR
jgi:GNAT superfamily N-acetyltransferase